MSKSQVKYTDPHSYYASQKDKFEEKYRKRIIGRTIFGILTLVSSTLAFKPELIGKLNLWFSMTGIVFQIGFWILALVFAFIVWFPSADYYNKKSGGKIKDLKIKKFYLDGDDSMEDIIGYFENKDLESLRDAAKIDSGSLTLYIEHDPIGKEAYLLLLNDYYGDVNYSSEVITISWDEYDENITLLKKI